jgi:hypothetical protein
MNQQWSAKSGELQRQIEGRSLSESDAMRGICAQACAVADAAGAAIARLKAGQLVYEAGSGTSAACAGRRVMAIYGTSATDRSVTEILRVEDAEADSRIQSAICRQFGARSLLILSFSSSRSLSGILQISFDQPHEFLDAELEAYRFLAGLAEKVVTLSTQAEQSQTDPAATLSRPALVPGNPRVPFLNESPIRWPRREVLSLFSRACDVAVAAMIVVASVGLVVSREPATVSLPLPVASQDATKSQAPSTSLPAPPPSSDHFVETATMPTARLHPRQHMARSTDRVRNFGDDVTTRYFVPKTAVERSRDGIEVRRIQDDVTVRYFTSTSAPQH